MRLTIAAVSLSFLMSGKAVAYICGCHYFLTTQGRVKYGQTWVKDSDPSVNKASFCEGLIISGTIQGRIFSLLPFPYYKKTNALDDWFLCYVGILSVASEKNMRSHERRLKIKDLCLCLCAHIHVYICPLTCKIIHGHFLLWIWALRLFLTVIIAWPIYIWLYHWS